LLESICIPASVESIGEYCFGSCERLASVSFERGSAIGDIHDTAFSNCPSLQSIDIPQSVANREFLLLSGELGKFVKRQRIKLHAPVCLSADCSSDQFWSGYDQYLSDQTK
jgi:hypothetical protein